MDITFASPHNLWYTLAACIVLAALYVYAALRRQRDQVRFSNMALLDKIARGRPGWRRHVIAAVFLTAAVTLGFAVAQPQRVDTVGVDQATIVVALDVSLSMEAVDVPPNRLRSAQDAVANFAELVDDNVSLSLVTFAGSTQVAVPPTTNRAAFLAGVENVELAEATAIGDAIDASLTVLQTAGVDGDAGVIVLLSDGETTVGAPSLEAAQRAADAGVAVNTIAYGTQEGTVTIDLGDGPETVPVPVNEAELEAVAELTGGTAYTADTVADTQEVFTTLGEQLGTEDELHDIAYQFAAAAFVLFFAAAAMAMWWTGRML